MATKEKQWWDPYETSHRRDFVYRPGSATHVCCVSPAPALFSVSGPFGSTQYSEDFTWKPICRPDCIRTGTASGTRKNNPHPNQSFLMWRLPREAPGSSQKSPSDREMCEAVAAQYLSTYRWDYSSWPPVTRRRLVSDYSRVRPLTPPTGTEMRDSYRRPIQRRELSHFLVHPDTDQKITNHVPRQIQAKQILPTDQLH